MHRYQVTLKTASGVTSVFIETEEELPDVTTLLGGATGNYKGLIKVGKSYLKMEDVLAIVPAERGDASEGFKRV